MAPMTISSGDTLTPTWREPGTGTSLSDNGGSLKLDLYGYIEDTFVRLDSKMGDFEVWNEASGSSSWVWGSSYTSSMTGSE